MTSSKATLPAERSRQPQGRRQPIAPALLIGLPLAGAILYGINNGPWKESPLVRYVSHPVECVEVALFCCALAVFGTKLWSTLREWSASRLELMPAWDGKPLPITKATELLSGLRRVPRRLLGTAIVQRTEAVLSFLCSRGSARELDDQLRTLADNDSISLDNSYSLTRFITWAIPILGFLGTVLGITGAIAGVTPERLENNLNDVTDGLALAFDATALALALTMVAMFLSFVVERAEQSVLDGVDRFVDRELAHRFERASAAEAEFIEALGKQSHHLTQTVEQLVETQAKVWARSFEEAEKQRAAFQSQQLDRMAKALSVAMEQTLATHAQRLQEQSTAAEGKISALLQGIGALAQSVQAASESHRKTVAAMMQLEQSHADALSRLHAGADQLRGMQELMNRNLETLASTGTFEQALHSLTAAIHLLTAHAPASNQRQHPRLGAAA